MILKAFRDTVAGKAPEASEWQALVASLAEEGLAEQAFAEFKRLQPSGGKADAWSPLRKRLEEEAARARERRMGQWQLDPRRRTLRLRLEVKAPACSLHPPALQGALAKALVEGGLPLAMGLEKSPRPLVRLGHPLPLDVEGLGEWADIVLREPAPLEGLPERIAPHCPQGLRILEAREISNHASPVLELCREARWAWTCPAELQSLARERFAAFEAAANYEIEKAGKVDGHKQVKRVEVRHLVLALSWEGDTFHFTTRLSASEALNPRKLLAGVLGLEAGAFTDLARLAVELAEDPRLKHLEKYEPKLHNLFEDAVLLGAGSNIEIIDEDDDEPIVLE